MSGICDTCKATRPCPAEGDGLRFCDFYNLYNRGESNYTRLFGTPERAARTVIDCCGLDCIACLLPTDCPCHGSFCAEDADYDALLEWLRGESE